MGVVVLGTLVYKRHRERPRRTWRIWLMDVAKQLSGQLIVHMLNVTFSAVGAMSAGNPCSLYFLNIALDSTLGACVRFGAADAGVGVICAAMHILTYFFHEVLRLPGCVSGDYGGSGSLSMHACWLRPTGVFVLSLITMKLVVLFLLSVLPFLNAFGSWLLGLFGTQRSLQVVFVMALFPMAMNMLQFWLIDSMLQHKPTRDDTWTPVPSTHPPSPKLDENDA